MYCKIPRLNKTRGLMSQKKNNSLPGILIQRLFREN
jgi:hypothetical protein